MQKTLTTYTVAISAETRAKKFRIVRDDFGGTRLSIFSLTGRELFNHFFEAGDEALRERMALERMEHVLDDLDAVSAR